MQSAVRSYTVLMMKARIRAGTNFSAQNFVKISVDSRPISRPMPRDAVIISALLSWVVWEASWLALLLARCPCLLAV